METMSKILILTDNIVKGKGELLGENGMSVYIEADGMRYLFDTGHGISTTHNAVLLNIRLNALKGAIISHSHPDHSGGLDALLAYNKALPIFTHPHIFNYRYRIQKKDQKRYSGVPHTRGYLEKKGASFIFNRDVVKLEPWLYLTGEIPRVKSFENADLENRYVERDGIVEKDVVMEEQAIIINAHKGPIVVTGCAHAGIVNTIEYAMKITGCNSVYAVIGGTHLGFADQIQIKKTLDELKKHDIARIITGHCTGIEAAVSMKQSLGNRFEFSYVGKEIPFKPTYS